MCLQNLHQQLSRNLVMNIIVTFRYILVKLIVVFKPIYLSTRRMQAVHGASSRVLLGQILTVLRVPRISKDGADISASKLQRRHILML